jgi:hypothetical protein
MKWLNDIKQQIPMEQLQMLVGQIRANIAAKQVKKEDPVISEADKILKRIHYLVSEASSLDFGKQDVFTRAITDDHGNTKNYTYSVNFHHPEEIKRLRTVLLELADLSSPDASKAKKESIPGYLDYIAQASI